MGVFYVVMMPVLIGIFVVIVKEFSAKHRIYGNRKSENSAGGEAALGGPYPPAPTDARDMMMFLMREVRGKEIRSFNASQATGAPCAPPL